MGRVLFFLMLCAIVILASFLIASHSQYSELKDDFDSLAEKYNYRLNDLYYYKRQRAATQTHMDSLYQSLYVYIYIYIYIH